LRLREFIVKRITVVKFGVNDRAVAMLQAVDEVRYSKADECDSNSVKHFLFYYQLVDGVYAVT